MNLRLLKSIFTCGFLLLIAAFSLHAQKTDSANGHEINKRPLRDLTNAVTEQVKNGEIDLNAPFLLELKGSLSKDGKLDTKTTKFVKEEGDPRMVKVAKNSLEAISDSGYLQYLNDLGCSDISFRISQNTQDFDGLITCDTLNEKRARAFQSTLNMLISMVGMEAKSDDASPKLKQEMLLLQNVTATQKNSVVSFIFMSPKATFWEIVIGSDKTGTQTEH